MNIINNNSYSFGPLLIYKKMEWKDVMNKSLEEIDADLDADFSETVKCFSFSVTG